VVFQYPVETILNSKLFIVRPGHKKNFDFKVHVDSSFGFGEGSHVEIAKDLRNKKHENQQRFKELLNIVTKVYNCSENDIDKILKIHSYLEKSFKSGAKVEVFLKVVKWLFIMEDIVYWDNEGRAFLFNFLRYATEETDESKLNEVFEKINSRYGLTPDQLKSFMKKCNLEWIPFQGKK
jgi:hypothetical protein